MAEALEVGRRIGRLTPGRPSATQRQRGKVASACGGTPPGGAATCQRVEGLNGQSYAKGDATDPNSKDQPRRAEVNKVNMTK